MKSLRRFKKDLSLKSLKGLERQVSKLLKELTAAPFFSNLPKGLVGDLKLGILEGLSNARPA